MPSNAIVLQPGETLTVVAVDPNGPRPSHPIMLPGMPGWGSGGPPLGIWGPTDPRPTHPIAGWNPGTGTWPQPPGPVDPGYSPPWAQIPPGGPVGGPPYPDQGLPPFPSHPIVIPPTEPPPVKPPTDTDEGNWVWAWSPQLGRWVWVKVPGEGEAGPKT